MAAAGAEATSMAAPRKRIISSISNETRHRGSENANAWRNAWQSMTNSRAAINAQQLVRRVGVGERQAGREMLAGAREETIETLSVA